jgi:hypothetical protein
MNNIKEKGINNFEKDNSDYLIEHFNNEINIDLENNDYFQKNECPLKFPKRSHKRYQRDPNTGLTEWEMQCYYDIEGNIAHDYNFVSAYITKLHHFPIIIIMISILFCFTFYLNLYSVIITQDIAMIKNLVIIYIIGTLIQILIVPNNNSFEGKFEFQKEFEKILNSYVEISIVPEKNKKNKRKYKGEYVVDITGKINIPKNYNFVQITNIVCFFDYNYLENLDNINESSCEYNKRFFYNNKEVLLNRQIFMVNSNETFNLLNCSTLILCIFLLHWIKTLYFKYSSFYDCITISPYKLISKKLILNSPTKIKFQGKIFTSENYIKEPLIEEKDQEINDENKEIEKDEKEEDEEDENEEIDEEENEEEEEENENKNNYNIKIK